MVCGFDMLRCDNGQKSQVIDVNGWSFVKGNESYYGKLYHSRRNASHIQYELYVYFTDRTAEILASLCVQASVSQERPLPATEIVPVEQPTWLLKANVTVFRHADRTPKQKLKFNFPIEQIWTQPFVRLLNGEKEEIILRERSQLSLIATAVEEAKGLGADGEDLVKLSQLNNALFSKIELPGTKAQLKPVYSKKNQGRPRRLTKLTLVFKWGGEVRFWRDTTAERLTLSHDIVHTLGEVSISGFGRKYEERDFHNEYVPSCNAIFECSQTYSQNCLTDKEVLKNVKVRTALNKYRKSVELSGLAWISIRSSLRPNAVWSHRLRSSQRLFRSPPPGTTHQRRTLLLDPLAPRLMEQRTVMGVSTVEVGENHPKLHHKRFQSSSYGRTCWTTPMLPKISWMM